MGERYAAIDVDGVEKTFRIPRQHVMTIKERALHPFRRVEIDELRALNDISFQILQGEFFGIVGRNGSGKSTLLKLLAGIYSSDAGHIRIAGRLTPFIELGVGFNPELTALDNVVINGVMMGMSPAQARARFDAVIEFAELQKFLDLKLKNYSSGMQVRLAFSLMVQSDADILLIDEVLAVGDAAFQQKCFDQFRTMRDEGRTIVLVTHDMPTIERFCHRAMLLEHGRMVDMGLPSKVAQGYMELNFEHQHGAQGQTGGGAVASVPSAWVETQAGRVDSVAHGEPLTLHAVVAAHGEIEQADIRAQISNDDGVPVFATRASAGTLGPGERARLTIRLENPLQSGRYYLDVAVYRGEAMVAFASRSCDFLVHGGTESALVSIEHTVDVEREPADERARAEA